MKRFAAIYFPYLKTDWLAIRRPELKDIPVVLSAKEHNRIVVTAEKFKGWNMSPSHYIGQDLSDVWLEE